MSLKLIGRHRKAARHPDVREAIAALNDDQRFSQFAIGKITHRKSGRPVPSLEIRMRESGGTKVILYGRNIIVEGIAR